MQNNDQTKVNGQVADNGANDILTKFYMSIKHLLKGTWNITTTFSFWIVSLKISIYAILSPKETNTQRMN